MELRSLVSSLGYLVSNRRQVLLGDTRLGGSTTFNVMPQTPNNIDPLHVLSKPHATTNVLTLLSLFHVKFLSEPHSTTNSLTLLSSFYVKGLTHGWWYGL